MLFVTNMNIAQAMKGIEIGGMIGGATYYGELNHIKPIHNIGPSLQALLRYNFHKQLALRGNLGLSVFSIKDAKSEFQYNIQRNHNFESTLLTLSTHLELNFLPFTQDSKKTVISPYLTLGLGASMSDLRFESGFFNNFLLPFGFGAKINLPSRWSAGVEFIYHQTFRDDIDNIPTSQFAPTAPYPLKQISNTRNNDSYSFLGIYISYKLKSSVTCRAYSMTKQTTY